MKVENPEAYKIYNNPNATDAELELAAQYFDGSLDINEEYMNQKYGENWRLKTNLGHSLI